MAFVATDVALNVLAFLPFGWALRRGPIGRTALLALIFSAGLECLQMYVLRVPSAWDIVSNTLGALIGARMPIPRARVNVGARSAGIVAIALALAGLGVTAREVRRHPETDFSNWQLVPFYIGAEEIGEPLWEGVLRRVVLYDRRVELRNSTHGDAYREAGPILDLNFIGVAAARLDGPLGSSMIALHPDSTQGFRVTERGLALGPGHWALPDTIARHVLARARASSAISIVAEFVPAPEPQPGIRRLFALSAGAVERNFSVVQRDGRILVRVRSPYFGTDGDARPVAVGAPDVPMTVTAVIDRHWFAVTTDQGAVVEEYLPSRVMPWPLGAGFSATYAAIVVLIVLGVSTLVSRGPARVAAMTASATVMCAAMWATGVFDRHAVTVWNVVLPPIGWLLACLYLNTGTRGREDERT